MKIHIHKNISKRYMELNIKYKFTIIAAFIFLTFVPILAIINLFLQTDFLNIIIVILSLGVIPILAIIDREARQFLNLIFMIIVILLGFVSLILSTPIFVKYANLIFYQKDNGIWISFFGQLIASITAIFGALWVSRRQNKSIEIENVKSSITMLTNDLKYISEGVKNYRDSLIINENPYYYRIKYLNISTNWRELIGILHKNRVIKRKQVIDLYDYFTDISYITDKYNQLSEINNLNGKDYEEVKLKIKKEINKKYAEMDINYEDKIKKIFDDMFFW